MRFIKHILVATDFSDSSAVALQHAAALATLYKAELHMLHVQQEVVPLGGVGDWPMAIEFPPEQREVLQAKLDAFAAKVDVPVNTSLQWHQSIAEAINKHAQQHNIDLLVLGTHARRGLSRFFLGSVAAELVRLASIPALVVGAQDSLTPEGYQHILVGVDFSEASLSALQAADHLATPERTHITAMHAFDTTTISPYYVYNSEQDDRNWVQQQFDKTLTPLPLNNKVQTMAVMGRAHTRLAEFASESGVDLIVVGDRGLGMLDRLLMGSVTDRILRVAPCPVLVYRAEA